MRPEYDGVKFYSKNDMSIGWALEKAEPILSSFDASKDYDDINEILELYNIQELMNTGIALPTWSAEMYNAYQLVVKQFNPILGRFFGKIDETNFIDQQEQVTVTYLDNFWQLFVKYKVYKRISSEAMKVYLNKPETTMYRLLQHKELVDNFDLEFAEVLRVANQTPRILASKFLENSKSNYYLPKSLAPTEFETIFLRYVWSEDVNANILQLIYNAQSTAECPISDQLRLEAKRSYKKYWEDHAQNAVHAEYGIGVSLQKQDELKKFENHDLTYQISYDMGWLEESLDYLLILNNFRYVFEMIDFAGRSALVSVKSKIGAFEGVFGVDGVKFYKRGNFFVTMDMLSSAQMTAYNNFLLEHDIYLEEVFQWFFEKYIPGEFNILGFSMNASSRTATTVEKCRNLAAEMDGVLKQFRMFVRNGAIDRELYEMSSEHMVLEGIPSLLDNKYAYAVSTEIKNEMSALFSDQSILGYIERTKAKYSTLFQLLSKEKISINDFAAYQKSSINWLVERGSIQIENTGIVKLVYPRAKILKDLYEHDVICLQSMKSWLTEIESMIAAGDLRGEQTLLTQPETDYLNFELNKSQFSDGLDLRNKYMHGTNSQNEQEQQRDYIQLLKLMVLVITKMNDEFCIWADSKEVNS